MDGPPPTYDELLDLTRRQAHQIDVLRAEVERLKAELEQSRRAGKRQGASYRKCSSVLLTLTGLVVASAALVRSGHRLRRLAQPSYDRLVEAARHSAVQHVDETGWKIGGRSAWLWVFADAHATLYRIRHSRGHEVVVEVLGEDYDGVLVSDCFLAYDPLHVTKSKCTAHLLRRCSEVERGK